jgi:hypothetical protein
VSGANLSVFMNQRSFGGPEPAPTVIGQAYGGGFYAGQISTGATGVADYYLVVGPKSSAQSSTSLAWGARTMDPAATLSVINGDANTAAIVADGNATVYPAAWYCNNLTVGGKSDWYLPATMENFVIFTNLKPTTAQNSATGINPYSIPPRTTNLNSAPNIPTQTSVTAFQSGGSEAYSSASYWSSVEHGGGPFAYFLNFDTCQFAADYKDNTHSVRGIRRVAV